MANRLLIATPRQVSKFGNSFDLSRVFNELSKEGYVFDSPFNSFMTYYEIPASFNFPDGGFHISVHQKDFIIGGDYWNHESQEEKLGQMLSTYLGLGGSSRDAYSDQCVLLTWVDKVGLVRKVCDDLDIEPADLVPND